MKKISLIPIWALLALSLISLLGNAQPTIEYDYDDNGNRISRTVITLKGANVTTGPEAQAPEPTIDKIGFQEARIYPNPTKGLLRVELPSLETQDGIIRVFDSHGKLIREKQASQTNQVELSNHPSGFYFMQVIIGREKKEWKIIKE